MYPVDAIKVGHLSAWDTSGVGELLNQMLIIENSRHECKCSTQRQRRQRIQGFSVAHIR